MDTENSVLNLGFRCKGENSGVYATEVRPENTSVNVCASAHVRMACVCVCVCVCRERESSVFTFRQSLRSSGDENVTESQTK